MVTNAQLNGHAWGEIARAIGTSPEEACLRFDPGSPVADPRWPYDFQLGRQAAARRCGRARAPGQALGGSDIGISP
jgi:hypothetical protein